MTLLKAFGMDMYNTKTDFFAEPDWTAITDTNILLQTNQGRFGGGALRLIGAGGLGDVVQLDVGSTPTTLYFGGSFKIANYNHDTTILRFLEGANEHVRLAISNVNNNLELYVNGIFRQRFDVTLGFWHRMEVRLFVDNADGIVDILIDRNFGTNFDSFIGVSSLYDGDTQAGAAAFTDTIEFVSTPAASLETEILWDDITLNDDVGTINNTFLGDIRIQTIRPNADTLQIDMVPSSGVTNFNLVDDTPGPDVTDSVAPLVALDKDLYAATNVVSGFNNIHAVQVKAFGQGGDVGTQTIRLLVNMGRTELIIVAQDETSYDSTPVTEGTFFGGSGHVILDVLTMSDGSTITVDTVVGAVITEFTVTTGGITTSTAGVANTQTGSTGVGIGFTLTPETDNIFHGTEGLSGSQTLAAQQFHNFIFETDPDTSAAWIENNVNVIEIGVERDS